MNNENGYTLTELLVIMLLLVVLFASSCTGYVNARYQNAKHKVRVAETKSNIHTIQVALERYAVDSGGIYPLILYGGSPDDTFTVSRNFQNVRKDETEYSEFDGDLDVLLEFGYLSQYPTNPFQPKRDIEKYGRLITQPALYNLPQLDNRISIWSNHPEPTHGDPDRSKQMVERKVGGMNSDLMWDVSEGQRHSPFPIVLFPSPDPKTLTGDYAYVNPTVSMPGEPNYKKDHLFFHLPGNFYYYARFKTTFGYALIDIDESLNPEAFEPTGYYLAGYGDITNSGQDVYNIFGDYHDASLLPTYMPNVKKVETIAPKWSSGPDGRRDGVFYVLSCGWGDEELNDFWDNYSALEN